jgi:hypothetical protein
MVDWLTPSGRDIDRYGRYCRLIARQAREPCGNWRRGQVKHIPHVLLLARDTGTSNHSFIILMSLTCH